MTQLDPIDVGGSQGPQEGISWARGLSNSRTAPAGDGDVGRQISCPLDGDMIGVRCVTTKACTEI